MVGDDVVVVVISGINRLMTLAAALLLDDGLVMAKSSGSTMLSGMSQDDEEEDVGLDVVGAAACAVVVEMTVLFAVVDAMRVLVELRVIPLMSTSPSSFGKRFVAVISTESLIILVVTWSGWSLCWFWFVFLFGRSEGMAKAMVIMRA
jgi:hypothetical protein